jgi:hypothetical protein
MLVVELKEAMGHSYHLTVILMAAKLKGRRDNNWRE